MTVMMIFNLPAKASGANVHIHMTKSAQIAFNAY